MESLRKFWTRFFTYNWVFGLSLILLFGIPRFIMVLQANVSGGYSSVFIIFLLMWFAPLIFLTKQGRKNMGMKRPNSYLRLLYSFVLGALSCVIIFGVFWLLYQNTESNAFTYISKTSGGPMGDISDSDKLIYFIIAVIPTMLVSPIGEEFFFRGVVHGSFVGQFGETKASIFDSLAFAFTHLAHFGVVYLAGQWTFLPLPAIIWIISMFAISQLFFRCRTMCDSILGAVFSHAGFNFAMMYFIFYVLL